MTVVDTLLAKDEALRKQFSAEPDSVSTADMNALIKAVRTAGPTTGAVAQRQRLQTVLRHWGKIVEDREGYKPGLILPPYDPDAVAEAEPDDDEILDLDDTGAEPEANLTYIPGEAVEDAKGMTLAQLFMTMPLYAKVGILVVLALLLAGAFYAILFSGSDEIPVDPAATETAVAAAITASAQPSPTATATATPLMYIEPEVIVEEPTIAGTPTPSIYVVQTGDTLNSIARKYGVSVQDITLANNLYNPNSIAVGQELIIPTPGPGTSAPNITAVAATPAPQQADAGQTGAPVSTAPTGPLPELVIRSAEAVELRIAAGPDYQAITSLPSGTFASIVAKTPDGQWYLIQLEDGYTRGWIPAQSAVLLYPANPETIVTTPLP